MADIGIMEVMPIEPQIITHLQEWIGKTESLQDTITAAPVKALSATLDRPDPAPSQGTFLPELWHWLYFLPCAPQSDIGADGHPKRGGFLPPVPLPRRMWAGSRVQWLAPLSIGDEVERVSTIESVTHKAGRTGNLIFVLVKHQISNRNGPALIEEHDIVYRDAPGPDDKPVAPMPAPTDAKWTKTITPDDVLLFRYSALTFNGHRIHYDRKYATEVEAYPGLIVHGPLIATLLVDLIRQSIPGCTLKSFEFRAIRPTFDINPFKVSAKPDLEKDSSGKTISIWAEDHEGWLTMKATAVLAQSKTQTTMTTQHLSRELAHFAANLTAADIPSDVMSRAEDLLVDWFGSAIAGKGSRPVETITQFAQSMGGFNSANPGSAEILINRTSSSPFLAALANAAASHVAEQDDVHNGSVFHPATVVFPAALATAQTIGASGEELLVAAIAGYEVGIRVGEFLGRSHYKTFHTTGTAGTLAAAAAVGHLLKLNPTQMLHAFGSAGTQSAGLWEFLRDAADSKQLHTAHAAATGLMSAYLAQSGFTGAEHILEGKQGLAAGMSSDADPSKLTDRLGSRWTIAETSFKYHASCRHTHPAADALLQVMLAHDLKPSDIAKVETLVHQGAIDVLGPVTDPATVHQSKFSMGTVLALIAHYQFAGLQEFDQHFRDQEICAFRDRIIMVLDPEVDSAYPQRWIGKVKVYLQNGEVLEGRVDEPKGDPGNTLSRVEITDKAMRLAAFSGGATPTEMTTAIKRLWNIRKQVKIGWLIS